jgi:hypothetical protein
VSTLPVSLRKCQICVYLGHNVNCADFLGSRTEMVHCDGDDDDDDGDDDEGDGCKAHGAWLATILVGHASLVCMRYLAGEALLTELSAQVAIIHSHNFSSLLLYLHVRVCHPCAYEWQHSRAFLAANVAANLAAHVAADVNTWNRRGRLFFGQVRCLQIKGSCLMCFLINGSRVMCFLINASRVMCFLINGSRVRCFLINCSRVRCFLINGSCTSAHKYVVHAKSYHVPR